MKEGNKKSTPKRHHYVPSGYLRAFTHTGDSVYYFDKKKREKGIQSRNVTKILRIPHFYSDFHVGDNKKPRVEMIFSAEIDDRIPAFTKTVEDAIVSEVTYEDYVHLRGFSESLLVNFFYRSPYTRVKAKRSFLSRSASLLSWLSFLVENLRFPRSSERSALSNNLSQDVIGNAHRETAFPKHLTLYFVAPHISEAFITGSNPVVVQFPKPLKFFGSRSELQSFYFLPLSPRAGVMFSDQPFEKVAVDLSKGSANRINKIVYTQSTKVVSHDRDILSRYALR